jgi:hypothetical protein
MDKGNDHTRDLFRVLDARRREASTRSLSSHYDAVVSYLNKAYSEKRLEPNTELLISRLELYRRHRYVHEDVSVKIPPLNFATATLPTNVGGVSCYCDSSIIALFMSNELLDDELTKVIDSLESETNVDRILSKMKPARTTGDRYPGNEVRRSLCRMVKSMREGSKNALSVMMLDFMITAGPEFTLVSKGSSLDAIGDAHEFVTILTKILDCEASVNPISRDCEAHYLIYVEASHLSPDPENAGPKTRIDVTYDAEFLSDHPIMGRDVIPLPMGVAAILLKSEREYITLTRSGRLRHGSKDKTLQSMLDSYLGQNGDEGSLQGVYYQNSNRWKEFDEMIGPASTRGVNLRPAVLTVARREIVSSPDVLCIGVDRGSGAGVSTSEIEMINGKGDIFVYVDQPSETRTSYTLIGAAVYTGGHYIAYVSDGLAANAHWYQYNDSGSNHDGSNVRFTDIKITDSPHRDYLQKYATVLVFRKSF